MRRGLIVHKRRQWGQKKGNGMVRGRGYKLCDLERKLHVTYVDVSLCGVEDKDDGNYNDDGDDNDDDNKFKFQFILLTLCTFQ